MGLLRLLALPSDGARRCLLLYGARALADLRVQETTALQGPLAKPSPLKQGGSRACALASLLQAAALLLCSVAVAVPSLPLRLLSSSSASRRLWMGFRQDSLVAEGECAAASCCSWI